MPAKPVIKNNREATCPYRDDITSMKKTVDSTHKTVNDMFNRLFVKKNGNPLVLEIEKNTKFRQGVEEKEAIIKKSKWRRRSFWLTLTSIVLTQLIILFKIFGGL